VVIPAVGAGACGTNDGTSDVLQRLGGSGVAGLEKVAVSVDHLDGPPAVAIHYLADAHAAFYW